MWRWEKGGNNRKIAMLIKSETRQMCFGLTDLETLMSKRENESLEFKEAKNSFDFEKLVRYCAALANEGGGQIVLGVTDKFPRRVVGTSAFDPVERATSGIIQRLRLRVEASVLNHPNGRVLIFNVPSRPVGMQIEYKGRYEMRAGEELVPMTSDKLKRIFDEAVPDFSAQICPAATLSDLDPAAIELFRERWVRKSGMEKLKRLSAKQLLTDAELLLDDRVTYAALILLGTAAALARHLGQSEVIFEYRSSEVSGAPQQRQSFRKGYLLYVDELWRIIDLRNDRQFFQDGLFLVELPTFNERVVREAINNAVCHRDYHRVGSVFVREYPRHLIVESPGGFPPDITVENILWQHVPRNRRLAEAFEKCGLVERSGQGVNLMFEYAIREAKGRPDYSRTDASLVVLSLPGEVQDPQFLRFLEKVGAERLNSFITADLLLLDLINREKSVPQELRERLPGLLEMGVIEKAGRQKHILSRGLYSFLGRKGTYTRKAGLDHETNKALILKHIEENAKEGSRFADLAQVLPSFSRGQLKGLLREMRKEGKIHITGRTSASRWYPGASPDKD